MPQAIADMVSSDGKFYDTAFALVARCSKARVLLVEGVTPQSTWPPGWVCVSVESPGEDFLWEQLVPVPVVLS